MNDGLQAHCLSDDQSSQAIHVHNKHWHTQLRIPFIERSNNFQGWQFVPFYLRIDLEGPMVCPLAQYVPDSHFKW